MRGPCRLNSEKQDMDDTANNPNSLYENSYVKLSHTIRSNILSFRNFAIYIFSPYILTLFKPAFYDSCNSSYNGRVPNLYFI